MSESTKRKTDHRAKLLFLAVIVAVMAVVYVTTQRGQSLLADTWGNDLEQTLRRATREKRKVLAFFTASPPGQVAERLATTTLRKEPNPQNIAAGRFLCVHVTVPTDLSDAASKRFGIYELPTMLLLDANGQELNRRVGMIGQLPFSHGFLDCAEIQKPQPKPAAQP
ncbi:MAG TPA: hypothetical protein VM695_00940 [Phycisphaerae bacterium]|nr:hypothetical protein [Phycisphaerae bacterium]